MNSYDVVVRFVANLGWCLEMLRSHFSSIDRAGATEPLKARTAFGAAERSGHLEGLGAFQLHGVGCRVTLDSGEQIDFDWDEDGDATFDAWRLRKFAHSIGSEETSDADLLAACRQLAAAGLLVEREAGWYALGS